MFYESIPYELSYNYCNYFLVF